MAGRADDIDKSGHAALNTPNGLLETHVIDAKTTNADAVVK